MKIFEINRLDKNLVSIDNLIVYMKNKLWYSCSGSEIGERRLKSLKLFLEKEESILNPAHEYLNEWDFLVVGLKQLNETGVAKFNIIEKFHDNPENFFNGIIEDSNGLNYELMEGEAEIMFGQCMLEHDITIQENFENKVLTFSFDRDDIF